MTPPILATGAYLPATDPAALGQSSPPPFSERLMQEAAAVNTKMAEAESALTGLATGQYDNLHQVMLQLEDARLSFQLLVQVRNKVLEGYQELMRTQI